MKSSAGRGGGGVKTFYHFKLTAMYNLDGSKNVFIARLSCKNDDRWQDVLHPFRHPILCHRIIKIYRSSDVNFYHPIFEKKQLTARQFYAALSFVEPYKMDFCNCEN